MTIDSIETLLITSVFVIPGFIIDGIIDAFCPSGKRKNGTYLLYCLLYSIVHCSICSWAYILVWDIRTKNLTHFLLLLCVIAIIGAVLLGVIIGLFKSKQWIRKIIRKINKSVKNPIPTAWDYVFFNQNEPIFVIVTLNDDSKIYGYYGYNSYSSSDIEERDLYLERIYTLGDNNKWQRENDDAGILIKQANIKTIEFIKEKINE